MKRQKLYILLLLFRHPSIYKFDRETEFDNFLSQFKLAKHQLIQTRHPKLVYVSGDSSYRYLETAWRSPSSDIEISRHNIIHRKDSNGKLHPVSPPEFSYYCSVNGLTAREIIYSDLRLPSSSFRITKDQAMEAFDILRKENFLDRLVCIMMNSYMQFQTRAWMYFYKIVLKFMNLPLA